MRRFTRSIVTSAASYNRSFFLSQTVMCLAKKAKEPTPAELVGDSIRRCAAAKDAVGASDALQAALRKNVIPNQNAIATTLFLCEKYDQIDEGIELIRYINEHLVPTNTSKFKWDEKTLTVSMRLLCSAGDANGALKVFGFLLNQGWARGRSFTPILELCHKTRDVATLEGVLQAAAAPGSVPIEFTDRDYGHIFGTFSSAGKPPSESLLDYLLRGMSEHTPTMSVSTAEELMVWTCTPPDSSIAPQRTLEINDADVDARGVCSVCGTQLTGIPFLSSHRQQLLDDIENVLVKTKCKSEKAKRSFATFCKYLKQIRPPTVIIDGANVGFYGVSKWYGVAKKALHETRLKRAGRSIPPPASGGVGAVEFGKGMAMDVPPDFELIDLAANELVKAGHRPLILLHERHGELHNQTDLNAKLFAQWRSKQLVYTTPAGLNDDLCWLYAGVHLNVNPETAKKPCCYILTNDLMRDHHFNLLSQRSFTRWRDRHRIGFTCERTNDKTALRFHFPPPFSECTQPVLRSGDSGEVVADGWHIPICDQSSQPASGKKDDGEDELLDSSLVHEVAVNWICLHRK